MATNIFTLSEKAQQEYSALVVRIENLTPIENSDRLAQTIVGGNSIVVSNQTKIGSVMVYVPIECAINDSFLSSNNLFELGQCHRNSNRKIVEQLIEEGKKDEAKKLVGFFNKHGRVKVIRLRGVPSMGFLIEKESLVKWNPKLVDVNLEDFVGQDFDTIGGKLFVEPYIPFVRPIPSRINNGTKKRNDKLSRFDRIIPNTFSFHYDTNPLQRNMHLFKPTDVVTITAKIHGTSSIHGNILVKNIKQLHCGVVCINKRIKREIKTLAKSNPKQYHKKREKEVKITQLKRLIKPTYSIGYGLIYSSRNVIKNKYIHKGVSQGFYGQDVWGDVNAIVSPFIEKGMTVYGEIVGYITNSDKMIQSPFDYGCKVGTNYFMPYRITTTNADNSKKEWNVMDVYDWTVKLIKNNPSLEGKVKPLTILYHGTLGDLYPNIPTENHWHENILEAMKNDKEHFGMEELEPLCHNRCPREGVVLRKENDPLTEAFKLKCVKFLEKERDMIDKGEFVDMEMQEALQEN